MTTTAAHILRAWSDPVRRFAGETRILTHLLRHGVPVAVPVLCEDGRACATDDDGAPHAVFPMLPNDGGDNVDSWQVGPDLLPVLWRTMREHDPVERTWLRAVRWIDDNFDVLRLPEPAASHTRVV